MAIIVNPAPSSSTGNDASTSTKGVVKTSVAPPDPANPLVVTALAGTGDPDGSVVANRGTLRVPTDANGAAYLKRLTNDQYGWFGLAEKERAAQAPRRFFVRTGAEGSDSNDGLSPGSAFATIGKALTTLGSTAGEILIAPGTYSETVAPTGNPKALRGVGSGLNNSVVIKAPSATTNCVNVTTGHNVFENITTQGFGTNWNGIGWNLIAGSHSHFLHCRHANADADTRNATYGGTALRLEQTEGCYFRAFNFHKARVGVHLYDEATENVFVDTRGSEAYDEALKIENTSGSNVFVHWKSTGAGDAAASRQVFDIGGGGGNVFIAADFDEGGTVGISANSGAISSDANVFIGGANSPATSVTVSGKRNRFINFNMNSGTAGSFTISGTRNVLEEPNNKYAGALVINGSNNVLRGEENPSFVSGTGWVRETYRDSAGTDKSGTNRNAYPWVGVNSAPADAEISAGQVFLWFDQTNGAAKLMCKAKEAGGTVRTGSVPLS